MRAKTPSVLARFALCATAALGGGVLAAGCGGVPGNAVATVDGQEISRTDYQHWLTVFTKSASAQAAQQQGSAKPTAKQLHDQTLQYLISERWLNGEAKAQNISVTPAEVKKSFADQKKQSFPKESDYQTFLKQSGQTEADVLDRVRYSLLSDKLTKKVAGNGGTVTDQQVSDFYDKNKSQYAKPESRDLEVVITKDQATAQKAKSAIQSGDSWKTVANKYSTDEQTKQAGGVLKGAAKGSLGDQTLESAVFGADKGSLQGPLKTQYGYFVFDVTGITPGSQQSLAQAHDQIKQTLQQQNQQKKLNGFAKSFQDRWRDKTKCGTGFRTSDCANGPAPTPTPTATPADASAAAAAAAAAGSGQ